VSLSLDFDGSTRGWLLPQVEARTLPNVDTSEGSDVEILPVRAHVMEERCRGCASCVEVCPFGAITVSNRDVGAGRRARIEAALCRGCNLCTAVCPTRAAVPAAISYLWWGRQMRDALAAGAGNKPDPNEAVVLACERRVGTIEQGIEKEGAGARVIRVRCIGQVDAGMLLGLVNEGGRRVHVVGCEEDSCRFGAGATLAHEQVECARAMLRFMGRNEESLSADWSPGLDRFKDPVA
jgi:heterodisulfide reductase subunit A